MRPSVPSTQTPGGFNAGPPIWPGGYNQNLKIFHSPGYVVVLMEMVHEARIIPIDGRGRLPMDMRPWTGSSLGRWEGDTLVVETTNYKSEGQIYEYAGARAQERLAVAGGE